VQSASFQRDLVDVLKGLLKYVNGAYRHDPKAIWATNIGFLSTQPKILIESRTNWDAREPGCLFDIQVRDRVS
jgi:hypothetical protein